MIEAMIHKLHSQKFAGVQIKGQCCYRVDWESINELNQWIRMKAMQLFSSQAISEKRRHHLLHPYRHIRKVHIICISYKFKKLIATISIYIEATKSNPCSRPIIDNTSTIASWHRRQIDCNKKDCWSWSRGFFQPKSNKVNDPTETEPWMQNCEI